MLCDNCHSSNAAGARFCTTCGAALPREALTHVQGQAVSPAGKTASDYSYDDGYSKRAERRAPGVSPPDYPAVGGVYPSYRPVYGQPVPPPQPRRQKSVFAIVCYMINGVLALCCMALPFLPCVNFLGRPVSAFSYAMGLLTGSLGRGYGSNTEVTGIMLLLMFFLPFIFQLLWAIFSFVRTNAAGGMGLTGSIIFTQASLYWAFYLLNEVKIGSMFFMGGGGQTARYLTFVPYLMIVLGVTGIVFSSVQISQRDRVR